MKLSQMFPSRFLQAEDLPPHQNTIVTITKIYPAEARQRGNSGDDPELKWLMRVAEFRKPMSLWRSTAKAIEAVLGTDDVTQWVGQQIAIYPATYISFGETKPCINVDKWRPEQTAPRPTGLVIAGDKRPIPRPAMDRFLGHLQGMGKRWDDFLAWTKTAAPDVRTLVWGVDMDAVPAGVLPAMKAFLDACARDRELGAGDIVDQSTGEVVSPPSTDVRIPPHLQQATDAFAAGLRSRGPAPAANPAPAGAASRPTSTAAASPSPVGGPVPDDDIPF